MKIDTKVERWLCRSVDAMVIEIYPPTPIMVTACINLLLPPLPKQTSLWNLLTSFIHHLIYSLIILSD